MGLRNIPAPRTKLGLFERMSLARSGKRDGKQGRFELLEVGDDLSAHMSAFMSSELEKFFNFRDDILKYYVITLDCHNLDIDLIDCDKRSQCRQISCKKCQRLFADAIFEINNTTENIVNSFRLQPQEDLPEPVKINYATDLEARTQKLMRCLNSKIRLIETTHSMLEAYFCIYRLKLKCYWETAQRHHKELAPILPADDLLIMLCNHKFLGSFEEEYLKALAQLEKYSPQE